jgi:transcriptional regulator with XRE-family HTH domain
MADQTRRTAAPSLAYKLHRLFSIVHPPNRGELSYKEVADAIYRRSGIGVSPAYLAHLRKGIRDNPRKELLEAIADVFEVHPSYFFRGEVAERVNRDLDLIAAMRDDRIRRLAAHASRLSDDHLRVAMTVVEELARLTPPGEARVGQPPHP